MMRSLRRRMAGIEFGQVVLVVLLMGLLLAAWAVAGRWDEMARERDSVRQQRVELNQQRSRLLANARRAGWVCGYAYARGLEQTATDLCDPMEVTP